MAQGLFVAGAVIFIALGAYHGLLTIGDLREPRAFTPTDEDVLEAMRQSHLALNKSVNLWNAWMGFNLSHSLGLILFGGGLLAVSLLDFPTLESNRPWQLIAVATAALYCLMSIRFWFSAPTVGTGTALLCFLAAFALARPG